jgi:hypothetical protein
LTLKETNGNGRVGLVVKNCQPLNLEVMGSNPTESKKNVFSYELIYTG